jgi:hypothetical protein
MTAISSFNENQIVIRKNDLKREFCIRITSVLIRAGKYRYRGIYWNHSGRRVTGIFDETELKPAKS